MSFDPYHQWLGIPPAEQPPNHYRLLGVAVFESDPDVISNAAYRQLAHVKTYQLGQHVTDSQRLLSEIVAARACLLNADSRAAYDLQFQKATPALPAPPIEAPGFTVTEPSRRKQKVRTGPLVVVISCAFVLVAVVVSIAIIRQQFGRRAATDHASQLMSAATSTRGEAENNSSGAVGNQASSTITSGGQVGSDVRARSGLEFDGDAWVETDLKFDGRTPLTIEIWVVLTAHHLQSIVANNHGLGLALQVGENGHWEFAVRDQQAYRVASSNEIARLGELVHVAGVFDGRVVRLFVNGRLQDSVGSLTSGHKVSNLRFMIGADPDFNSRPQKHFQGSIDAVHVSYAVLYESDFAPPESFVRTPSTALLLQLDEGAGDVATDSSVREHQATIHGAKWTKAP